MSGKSSRWVIWLAIFHGWNLLLPNDSGRKMFTRSLQSTCLKSIIFSEWKSYFLYLRTLRSDCPTLQNSAQLSPSSASLRVSQPNSFSSSPIMTHKLDTYGAADNPDAQQQAAFIKPLPCGNDRGALYSSTIDAKIKGDRLNPSQDDIPPIVLDPPPQGRRMDGSTIKRTSLVPSSTNSQAAPEARSNVQNTKNLATILRTSGPPPSRTTSARLPSRNDLMSEMQRTTWARHTTKWWDSCVGVRIGSNFSQ